MYAIIKASGKQYKVEPGQEFEIDRIQGEAGQAVDFSEVLLISKDENTTVFGEPTIAGAVVKAEIKSQFRGPKLIVFKMKRRKDYRKKNGHRTQFTEVSIKSVIA